MEEKRANIHTLLVTLLCYYLLGKQIRMDLAMTQA
jgi:hypothetical protein